MDLEPCIIASLEIKWHLAYQIIGNQISSIHFISSFSSDVYHGSDSRPLLTVNIQVRLCRVLHAHLSQYPTLAISASRLRFGPPSMSSFFFPLFLLNRLCRSSPQGEFIKLLRPWPNQYVSIPPSLKRSVIDVCFFCTALEEVYHLRKCHLLSVLHCLVP